MIMSLQANEALKRDDFLAATFSWITLAGYLILPSTSTSLAKADGLRQSDSG